MLCCIVSPQSEALEHHLRRSRTRALIRECSMLMLMLSSFTSAAGLPKQDNLKSCPEAVSGLGVLRCPKTSEGNSLTKRVLGFGNAANSNLLDLRAHNGHFIGSDRKSFLKASASVQAGHPVDRHITFFHTSFLMLFLLFSSFLLFSFFLFSLTLHFSHFSPFLSFLYGVVTGYVSPHPRLSF